MILTRLLKKNEDWIKLAEDRVQWQALYEHLRIP
jgi:hypothetical protein